MPWGGFVLDQSFSRRALERELQKGDFRGIATGNQETFKNALLTEAKAAAFSTFNKPANPLTFFSLKKKVVFQLPNLADELVVRKLCGNLKKLAKSTNRGRSEIVGNLILLLEEGVPYRVYRLDITSFYESFKAIEVAATIDSYSEVSPHSKNLLKSLLTSHASIGGSGVPRGLSLSAVLSDLMMQDFDQRTFSEHNVYFYARYVDDIIIITSSQEQITPFIEVIKKSLPSGLNLNPNKKTIITAEKRVTPVKPIPSPEPLLYFDYLGYRLSVHEPLFDNKKKPGAHYRIVTVDIASAKIKKLKTRIIRSFFDFEKNSNWNLLFDRIKYLTQNFSVYNSKTGGLKLAGIYHSYPQVSDNASSLKELDRFLRTAILSKSGKLFSKTALKLKGPQKRKLLAQSFVTGHATKSFVHFSALRISEIQKCWLN